MATALHLLVNHLVLPPQLPGKEDDSLQDIDEALIQGLLNALQSLQTFTPDDSQKWVQVTRHVLRTCMTLNSGGRIDGPSLIATLDVLAPGQVLILHVTEQNAGLLLSRPPNDDRHILIEAFEASAAVEPVLAAGAALQRSFPGVAVKIPIEYSKESGFTKVMCGFIEQASMESVKRFSARTEKAGASIIETRDTARPTLMTDFLMTYLEAHGSLCEPQTIVKRVRDEVYLQQGAARPWRRSPLWLVVRVGLIRHLTSLHGITLGNGLYKLLICLFLKDVIDSSTKSLDSGYLRILSSKLARRLYKLEIWVSTNTESSMGMFRDIFEALRPVFHHSLNAVGERLELKWKSIRSAYGLTFPEVQPKAHENDFILSMHHSQNPLLEILRWHEDLSQKIAPIRFAGHPNLDNRPPSTVKYSAFVSDYFELAVFEDDLQGVLNGNDSQNAEEDCDTLAEALTKYINLVGNKYQSDPEQMSVMILKVLELWVRLDWRALQAFPLLGDYHPGFSPDILNGIQLRQLRHLDSLVTIQDYLETRVRSSKHHTLTIFHDPTESSFAVKYFDNPVDGAHLRCLQKRIEDAAKETKANKRIEWESKSKRFDELQHTISRSICDFRQLEFGRKIHNNNCTKCAQVEEAERMTIEVYEEWLPSDRPAAKAAVFELAIPKAFMYYRNATWKIINHLARDPAKNSEGLPQRRHLKDWRPLKNFWSGSCDGVSLMSSTKAHKMTHYQLVRFPVLYFSDVCRENALKLAYFDPASKIYTGRQWVNPTFEHSCSFQIPRGAPHMALHALAKRSCKEDVISSNEIVASQTECPRSLSAHDYLAYQSLFTGHYLRWPDILAELGSSNLNFSTEATASLISYLTCQVGPLEEDTMSRKAHRCLSEHAFRQQLWKQIKIRIDLTRSNWREKDCMGMLLAIALQVYMVGNGEAAREALEVIRDIRGITLDWTRRLTVEIQLQETLEQAKPCEEYAFWAALLCKHTFQSFICREKYKQDTFLSTSDLQCFLEASICLQQNISSSLFESSSSPGLSALIRDTKSTCDLRYLILFSCQRDPSAFFTAIDQMWPQPEGAPSREYNTPEFLDPPFNWWMRTRVLASDGLHTQDIMCHILEGHLLVDGQPVGKLSDEHRQSPLVKQLFGQRNLFVRPSAMVGMEHQLTMLHHGHEIHVGSRAGEIFICARREKVIYELVPQTIFGPAEDCDLPIPFIANCVHWLHVKSRHVDICPGPDIWAHDRNTWRLEIDTRQAGNTANRLLDPRCQRFRFISSLFAGLEYQNHILLRETRNSNTIIELRRLDLSFEVQGSRLLKCWEINAEVDPNQDAGTWYGLQSKLVLRDLHMPELRKIIIPIGEIRHFRDDFHIGVVVERGQAETGYMTFDINQPLGRVDCVPEPRLVYTKALMHALTSYPQPDPLTQRTGTEEALACLRSGVSQPWAPLTSGPISLLEQIASLSPSRTYYPTHLQQTQTCSWSPHVRISSQDDCLRMVVETIINKSQKLGIFYPERSTRQTKLAFNEQHLSCRADHSRKLYDRSDACSVFAASDLVYESRDKLIKTQSRSNAFEIASIFRHRPSQMAHTDDLWLTLRGWDSFKGHTEPFTEVLISNCLGIDLKKHWGSLVMLYRSACVTDHHRLALLLAQIVYAGDVDMKAARTLVSYFLYDDVKAPVPPLWDQYEVVSKYPPLSLKDLSDTLLDYVQAFSETPWGAGVQQRKKYAKAKAEYEENAVKWCNKIAIHLLKQWPCEEPSLDGFSLTSTGSTILRIDDAMPYIKREWRISFAVQELREYVKVVQAAMRQHWSFDQTQFKPKSPLITSNAEFKVAQMPSAIYLRDLLKHSQPVPQPSAHINGQQNPLMTMSSGRYRQQGSVSKEFMELKQLIADLTTSASAVKRIYATDLMRSVNAFEKVQRLGNINPKMSPIDDLTGMMARAAKRVTETLEGLKSTFSRREEDAWLKVDAWLRVGRLWPAITPITLLEQLQSVKNIDFGIGTRELVVEYGLAIAHLQRIIRIRTAKLKDQEQQEHEERRNLGHTNWSSLKHPDWLLLELDGNFLIRENQVDVAKATISPASSANSVLQMNMGQGKTSCIMPMAAAVLANQHDLMRLVVPNALLLQTAQLMQMRLGGLVGREVRHVPFFRRTLTDETTIMAYRELHASLRRSGGLIIGVPEHNLSFQLSGIQRLLDGKLDDAGRMIKVQAWMQKYCRQILDESDFILAVRTQLIYPSGSQQMVDGHPHRWEVAEQLLALVESHARQLMDEFPHSIDIVFRQRGCFPVIYFLKSDVEQTLVNRIAFDVSRGLSPILQTRELPESQQERIKTFISQPVVTEELTKAVAVIFSGRSTGKILYLLRGLLVHRILIMTLKKRWNVQYGLHPNRDPIAVPFHAKGVPSDDAEWGHPDVAIMFTCLAFYLGGLKQAQLVQALTSVVNSDDPASEYNRWTQFATNMPDSLHQWNQINTSDDAQMQQIWSHLRCALPVINYYLNHFVFPRHAKQFGQKLQASGWDIALTNTLVRDRPGKESPLTTGFSGTNDNKTLLPFNITQRDLQGLSHTNAEVLSYLLQKRNRGYVRMRKQDGGRLSEIELLGLLKSRAIRILIDAGAQILELTNKEVAARWLKIDRRAKAAVYFNHENKAMVLYQKGTELPLLATPFANNLGECLIYLDEAHTRGTDLKLPANAVGALTLGLGQTKDHTVQAAMRLRQLGTTQSVKFFAPPEVHQSILDVCQLRPTAKVESLEVIRWLLHQTTLGIEQVQPLHYAQGMDYCKRTQAILVNSNFLNDEHHRTQLLDTLKQKEHQKLWELYKPKFKTRVAPIEMEFDGALHTYVNDLTQRRRVFEDNGSAVHASALQEVEQEREVAHEVETVREIQKPPKHDALPFLGLHEGVIHFTETGNFHPTRSNHMHYLAAIRQSDLGLKYIAEKRGQTSRLYVSEEFMRTIKLRIDVMLDAAFMRPVQHILWSPSTSSALVITPEEAELLSPRLYDTRDPMTHLLTYAAPVTRKMLQFNDLKYYAVPALPADWNAPTWLKIELGLLAGRLYFPHDEYALLHKYFGIKGNVAVNDGDAAMSEDAQESEVVLQQAAPAFGGKAIGFLMEWLAVRRKGQDFTQTPMGFLCQGRKMGKSHPFFAQEGVEVEDEVEVVVNGSQQAQVQGGSLNEESISTGDEAEETSSSSEGAQVASSIEDEEMPPPMPETTSTYQKLIAAQWQG